MSSQQNENSKEQRESQDADNVEQDGSTKDDTASTLTAAAKKKEIANPSCKMNRTSEAPSEMITLLAKLDGEGEPNKKPKVRTKK